MLQKRIVEWIKQYAKDNNRKTLVIGISGGIDSSVVSTLCAMTKMKTIAVSLPLNQIEEQHDLSMDHGDWLSNKYKNVTHELINLDRIYEKFWLELFNEYGDEHAFANSKSRLRMTALHQIAGSKKGLVVGTGNKVEDFGVGFYTKYGDGGVDISPIADCTKSDVWELGKELKIAEEIIKANPTDGLWDDGRTDEGQLGLKYEEVEDAMKNPDSPNYEKYIKIRKLNLHKMEPIPVCKIPE